MPQAKLNKFARALRAATDAVHGLESAGIDVDRLIGISNAQGPQAKVIQSLLNSVMELVDQSPGSSFVEPKPVVRKKAPKKLKSS